MGRYWYDKLGQIRARENKKKMKNRQPDEMTLHHRIPQSRCPEFLGFNADVDFYGNCIKIRLDIHEAWHVLFDDSTPTEAISVIRSQGKERLTRKPRKMNAWNIVFGSKKSDEEVIKIIETHWMGPEVAKILNYPLLD